MLTLRDFVKNNDYFIVAHRGSSGTAPENTMASFREAYEAGAQMIEADIHFTSDGEIVSFHDSVLGRTTDGKGRTRNFAAGEQKKLDAGSWFDKRFAGEKIPFLQEVLEFSYDRFYVNIEVKPDERCNSENIINKLIGMVKSAGMGDRVLFSSFDYRMLGMIKEIDENLPTAAIRLPGDKTLPSEISSKVGCDAFVCSLTELNRSVSVNAFKNDIFVGVYSVNNEIQLQKAMKHGVKAVVTNFPARIKSLIEDHYR